MTLHTRIYLAAASTIGRNNGMIKKSILVYKILTYVPIAWVVVFSSFIIRAKVTFKGFSVFGVIPPYALGFGVHYTVTYWLTALMFFTMAAGIVYSVVLLIMSAFKENGREEMKKNNSMKAFLIVYFLILIFFQFDPNKLIYWILA